MPVFLHTCSASFQKSPFIRAEKPLLTGHRPKREVQHRVVVVAIGLRGAELQSREGEAHPALCKYRSARCDRGLGKRGSSEPVSTSTPTIARTTFEFSAAKQIATNLPVATNSASGVPNITLLFEVSRCAFPSSRLSHRACRGALRI